MGKNDYIRFDWAIKRLLRDKANFSVLEGLLTVLFNDKTQIVEILRYKILHTWEDDKLNRVDIKAKNSKGEVFLVEVQNMRELYYWERILYGTPITITEHIPQINTRKIYFIYILDFDLGKGNDYLYHGQNHFIGVHTNDELMITAKEEIADRGIPRTLLNTGKRIQPSSKDSTGRVDTISEDRRYCSEHNHSGVVRSAGEATLL